MYRFPRFHHSIYYSLIVIAAFEQISEQMKNKIVNDICRNPRRTKRNINIICRYGRGNDFFNRFDIFSKISVVFFIGFFSCFPFSYHVAGQIFLRGFPAFIEALAPGFRVLINRAFQRTDNCLVVLSCY